MILEDLERASKPVPIVDPERCDGCGRCVRVCAGQAIAVVRGKAFVTRPDACRYDGSCERICPAQAICLPFEIVFDSEPHGSRREIK